jgi:ankyrin repeat protein
MELSELHQAVRAGNLERARALIEAGADVKARSPEGRTALHVAAETGHVALVRLLLEAGAEVDARMEYGQTPLHRAATLGRAIDLCDKDPDVSPVPLPWPMAGVAIRDPAFLKVLQARNPLLAGLRASDPCPDELAFELLATYFDALKDHRSRHRLHEELKAQGCDPDSIEPGFGRRLGAELTHVQVAAILLDHGAQIDALTESQSTPLAIAARSGEPEIVALLLARGADPNGKREEHPMVEAAESGHVEIVRLLLKRGARCDEALLTAAGNDSSDIVTLLLDAGWPVDARDCYGQTPLMRAVRQGSEVVTRLLLERGADIEAQDVEGDTPLMMALDSNHEGLARFFLDRGASIHASNKKGQQPLHLASANMPAELIRRGARVDARSLTGHTPLHEAARNLDLYALRILLDAGADVHAAGREREHAAARDFRRLRDNGSGP